MWGLVSVLETRADPALVFSPLQKTSSSLIHTWACAWGPPLSRSPPNLILQRHSRRCFTFAVGEELVLADFPYNHFLARPEDNSCLQARSLGKTAHGW